MECSGHMPNLSEPHILSLIKTFLISPGIPFKHTYIHMCVFKAVPVGSDKQQAVIPEVCLR